MVTYRDAMEIIAKHQVSAPVQTIPIARELGLEVYRVRGWRDTISGMIKQDASRGGKSGFAIFVNATHAATRRRFTIAHEIGHYVLHQDRIGDGITDDALYRSKLGGAIEVQANRFAADLLIPDHLLRRAIEDGMESVEDLAHHFDVSKSSMSIRLGVPYETRPDTRDLVEAI